MPPRGSDQDVYVTCEGRMQRTEDQLKSRGVRDGSAIQVMNRMRGGGKHKDKKNKVERSKPQAQRHRSRSSRTKRATEVRRFWRARRRQLSGCERKMKEVGNSLKSYSKEATSKWNRRCKGIGGQVVMC